GFGAVDRPLLVAHVGVQVDVGRLDLLVPEPQGDDGDVVARNNLVQSDVRSELVSQTQPRRIAAARSAPGAAGGSRPCPRTAVGLRRGRSTPTLATARRSGALTLVPLPGQLLDRARQS